MKSFQTFHGAKKEALKIGGHVIDIHGGNGLHGLHVVPQGFALDRSYFHDSDGHKVKFTARFVNDVIRYEFGQVTNEVDGFQIQACKLSEDGRDVDPCEDGELPDFWTVYTRLKSEGIHLAVADFSTEKQAEKFVTFLKSFAQNYEIIRD